MRTTLQERLSIPLKSVMHHFVFTAFETTMPSSLMGVIFFFPLRSWGGDQRERFIPRSASQTPEGSLLTYVGLWRDYKSHVWDSRQRF